MKFKQGDRVRIRTEAGSCLNGVAGVVESPKSLLLGVSAFYVKFDKPVVYPSGNIVERDIIFEYELRKEDLNHVFSL